MGLNLVDKAAAGGLSSLSSPRTRVFLMRCVLTYCPVKGKALKKEPRARLLHIVFELFHSLSSKQFPSNRITMGNRYLNCLTSTVKED